MIDSQSNIILIIDDSQVIRQQIINFIQQKINLNKQPKLVIFEIKTGQKAIDFFQNYAAIIKLIFLDLFLPTTGIEVFKYLQNHHNLAQITLVIMTHIRDLYYHYQLGEEQDLLTQIITVYQKENPSLAYIKNADTLDINLPKIGLLTKPFNDEKINQAIQKAIKIKKI